MTRDKFTSIVLPGLPPETRPPVRLRLSRAKGFNLQEHSHATNGLEAVVVRRPSKWGNPFTAKAWREVGYRGTDHQAAEACKFAFEDWLKPDGGNNLPSEEGRAKRAIILQEVSSLTGKNLACTCALDAPCHADVLLEIANSPICERVG